MKLYALFAASLSYFSGSFLYDIEFSEDLCYNSRDVYFYGGHL